MTLGRTTPFSRLGMCQAFRILAMNIRVLLSGFTVCLFHGTASSVAAPLETRPMEITVSVTMQGQKHRVPVKQPEVITVAAFGNLHGTNQLQLWVNNRLVGSVRAVTQRIQPLFRAPTNSVQGTFLWAPTEPGNYEFIAQAITGTGDSISSSPPTARHSLSMD